MHSSKEKGKNTYSFYDVNFDEATQRRYNIDKELRNANMNEFTVIYQPQFDIKKEIYMVLRH